MATSNYNPGQELSSIDFQSMIGGPLGAIVSAQAQAALSTVDFIKSVGFTPDSEDETTGEVSPGTPVYVNFKYPKMVEPYQPAIRGKITAIDVTNGGTGYSQGATVTISGSGTGATGVATVDQYGVISSITVTDGGSGYDAESTTVSVAGGNGLETTITTEDTEAVPAVFNEMQLEVPILTMLPIPFIRVEEGEIDFHAKITSMEYSRVGSTFKTSRSFGYNSTHSGSSSVHTGALFSLFAKAGARARYNSSVNLKVNASYQRTTRQGSKVDKTYQLGVKVKVSQDEIPAGMEKLLGILEDAIVAQPIAE
jgi:hypothetical protein